MSITRIPLPLFLERIQDIAALNPAYRSGGSGTDGTCDCIGLIIGAIRRSGGSWRGLHGSNYAARFEMDSLQPVRKASDLRPGEVVYKALSPEEKGYNLPARYKLGGSDCTGDLRDYYHIGVVFSTSPLQIVHMTEPSARTDTSLGKWTWHGQLKKVEAEEDPEGKEGEKPMNQIKTVTAQQGDSVYLRPSRSTSEPWLAKVPLGEQVEVLKDYGMWTRVRWNGKSGYMQSQFLTDSPEASVYEASADLQPGSDAYSVHGDGIADPAMGHGTVILTIPAISAQSLLPILELMVSQMVSQIGRG